MFHKTTAPGNRETGEHEQNSEHPIPPSEKTLFWFHLVEITTLAEAHYTYNPLGFTRCSDDDDTSLHLKAKQG
jgi:hypothetical protein